MWLFPNITIHTVSQPVLISLPETFERVFIHDNVSYLIKNFQPELFHICSEEHLKYKMSNIYAYVYVPGYVCNQQQNTKGWNTQPSGFNKLNNKLKELPTISIQIL